MFREYFQIERNITVQKQNQTIVAENVYILDGKRIFFNHSMAEHQSVVVFTPEKIKDIENKEIPFTSDCKIQVINAGSFEQPTELVMNFANSVNPGGGYLYGAVAQEECLCRESTLYASISSKDARKMYHANQKNSSIFDTDYMLLSPYVEVFRNASLELLAAPHTLAVITIAAPNLYGKASMASQEEIDDYMKKRIRQYLKCGAYYGYKTATLGAWGCGAFGHDAKRVAEYFRCVLIEEGFQNYYDKIIFAIYDNTPEQYNYKCFENTF